MLDLVFWSILLTLTPWALGLAQCLKSAVARLFNAAVPNRLAPLDPRAGMSRRPPATRRGRGLIKHTHVM
jgi:hypothetical protein